MNGNHHANNLQIRASDPFASAWVNANAGSGKTHVLIDRLIRLMLAGTEPSRILCLTFTKAAAAEMSTRLFERLSGWITVSDDELKQNLGKIGVDSPDAELMRRARQLFTSALETPGGLKIQTIHAFCERLLQLFPVEAGIVPHFSVMDDRAARETLNAARQDVLREAHRRPESDIGRALAEVVRHVQADGFDELMKVILSKRTILDLDEGIAVQRIVDQLRRHFLLNPGEDKNSVRRELVLNHQDYQRLIAALDFGTARDQERGNFLGDVLVGSNSNLEELRSFLLTGTNEPRKLTGIATRAVVAADPWVGSFIESEQQRLIYGLGRLADLERIAATSALLTLAAAIIQEFEREKRRRGAYDFDDLIIRTNRLLASKPDAAWVLYKLDGGIEHVLLDEAQDTSPAQWEIIGALTEEFFAGQGIRGKSERTLFAVGDRKQSIFSFQGADPDNFEIVHDEIESRITAAGQPFNDVDFTLSFRSAKAILSAVDIAFHESGIARQGLDGRSSKQLHHEPTRREVTGTVEVWPMVEPDERGEDQPWQAPVDLEPANSPRRKLARAIAAKVKSWIGSKFLADKNRNVQSGDILILVRVRNSFFDALVRELRKADIAVAGADRLTLVENLAVLDLLALAQFCLLEDDDYALACLLKSPLVPQVFSEEQIFDIAWRRGKQSLWARMQQSAEPHCVAAVRQLLAWKEQARTARPYEFFSGVLDITRMRILGRLGSEARDALDAFLDSALDYENDNTSSLQGFVQWFKSGDVEIKRNMEQGSNEVRIMTVHGAKGLEAPIVILPDTMSKPEGKTQSPLMMIDLGRTAGKLPLWRLPKTFESPGLAAVKAGLKDDRAHEYRRLLYVAMTRARDELYICGYRGRNTAADDCWYNLVATSLQPHMRELSDSEGWRLGDDPVFSKLTLAAKTELIEIPQWALLPPAPEPGRKSWRAPSHLGAAERPQRVERGVLMHRILQLLPEIAVGEQKSFVHRIVIRAGYDESVALELLALTGHPELQYLFAAGGLSEVPIMASIGELGITISGRIDRLILRASEIVAVDYKTDRNWPSAASAIRPEYLLQMAAYQSALKGIHPGQMVRCAILWTAAPALMDIPDVLLAQMLLHNGVAHP